MLMNVEKNRASVKIVLADSDSYMRQGLRNAFATEGYQDFQTVGRISLLRDLLAYSRELMRTKARIEYFATSLPAMLLFEDDLQKRRTVTARFLEAQARLGLGQAAQARKCLEQVLAMDRNHGRAEDLLAEIQAGRRNAR